jgi:hypothetical protein
VQPQVRIVSNRRPPAQNRQRMAEPLAQEAINAGG